MSSHGTGHDDSEVNAVKMQWKQDHWIKTIGRQYQPRPDVFCMSWYWPKWWGPPEVFTVPNGFVPLAPWPTDKEALPEFFGTYKTFTKFGLPVRLLKFWSGLQVWQFTTPIHGFDEPGATLSNPLDTPLFPS